MASCRVFCQCRLAASSHGTNETRRIRTAFGARDLSDDEACRLCDALEKSVVQSPDSVGTR